MQIKVHNNKLIFICLLLCSLFLTNNISVLNTNVIISSDINSSSVSGGSEPSSMAGGIDAGHNDFMAAPNTSAEFSISSQRESRWLGAKTTFSFLTAIIAVQMAFLIYYSRLSSQPYTQSFASVITVFLHKKDGKK